MNLVWFFVESFSFCFETIEKARRSLTSPHRVNLVVSLIRDGLVDERGERVCTCCAALLVYPARKPGDTIVGCRRPRTRGGGRRKCVGPHLNRPFVRLDRPFRCGHLSTKPRLHHSFVRSMIRVSIFCIIRRTLHFTPRSTWQLLSSLRLALFEHSPFLQFHALRCAFRWNVF